MTLPSVSSPLRTAVIGCGHFGRFHAEKYAALPDATLVAVVDRDPAKAAALAAVWKVEALTDPAGLGSFTVAEWVI